MTRNWVDRTISYFAPNIGANRVKARLYQEDLESASRMYEGASHSKRTEGWTALTTSANSEIKTALVTLRSRARDLVRNNPYANRIVSVITTNTVGTGIMGQIKDETDDSHTHSLNTPWKEWAESSDCDYEGKMDFGAIQALVMRSVAESGECLVRIRTRRVLRKCIFQLQVLESDFLDTNKEGMIEGGGYIIQGIEYDSADKVIAYWIFPQHPGGFVNFATYKTMSQRVSADEILHIYRVERPGQCRGNGSWLAPIMLRLKDFDDYEDAELRRKKISCCLSVFVRMLDTNGWTSSKKMESFNQLTPGMISRLGPGEDIQIVNPPTVEGYSDYASQILHAVAVGSGITFEALTGDLSQVNFSSARMGWLEFQRNIESWRWNLLIPQLCVPIWEKFKQWLEISGVNTKELQMTWTPPKREMIDPSKEIPSAIDSIRGGLSTLSEEIRLRGFDPKQHLEEIAKDNDLLDELGLVLDSDPRQEALQAKQKNQAQLDGQKEVA